MANSKEDRFGVLFGAGEAFLAIVTGQMDSFMNQFRPVAVHQSPDGQYQMLVFDYVEDMDHVAYEEKIVECAKSLGIESATVVYDLPKEKPAKIIPFKKRGTKK